MSTVVAMFVGGPADGSVWNVQADTRDLILESAPPVSAWASPDLDAPVPVTRIHYVRVDDPALEASTGYVFFTPQTSSAE